MGVPDYEFLLTDAPEAVWAAVGPRYTVVAGARRHQMRVLLETFDGRLRAAGLALAYLSEPGGAANELVLTCPDGVTRQTAVVRWPAQVDAVPTGPVAERLRAVVGIRALLPVVRVRSDMSEWRVLNSDGKTVVRAYVDQPARPVPGAPRCPAGSAWRRFAATTTRLPASPACSPRRA